ncbi:hypothetical protein [Chryseobacterium sp. A301]
MRKIFIYIGIVATALVSCDDNYQDPYKIKEVKNLSTQNSNDDKAIAEYMDTHYLDGQGKIQAFVATTPDDDGNKKLSELQPKTLPSGVIVIVREGAQPVTGKEIGTTDVISIMQRTYAFLSDGEDGAEFHTPYPFANTVDGSGIPDKDPAYYYAKPSVLEASDKTKDYYEIEGFQEGLKAFKSFAKEDSELYNLQGVIIVPSRAAFARDSHFPYLGLNWRNRNFVFNFQIYNTRERAANEK